MMTDAVDHHARSVSACPCLHCGYDLRAAMRAGAGKIHCPECGHANQIHVLARHGLRLRAVVQLALLVLAPPATLMASAWLFGLWSKNTLHVMLCLILAPAVIIAHCFAVWQLIGASVVLTRAALCRTRVLSIGSAILLDLAACAVVGHWFL